ncbi:MAG: ribokinase [Selenomonas sp.]|uniref:ribokinase n=1 Tax=Selenomonas sp. TaxID=2053611 RepID=UPI0025FEA4BE|nr:ribokinase [Selenomonas sp.]MCR5758633.1 ribokinase [Selenomonas sp.]
MKKVLVVGSLNMDFDVYMERRPQGGETVMAQSLKLVPGGKGANQAYALGKLGVDTSMIGAVGKDTFGQQMLDNLHSVQVDTAGIRTSENCETGKAFIEIEDSGQNSISVIAGANHDLDAAYIAERQDMFAAADAVVMQLEVPMSVVVAAAKQAKACGKLVVVDPAPACADFPEELFPLIDITKPNETELSILTGLPTDTEEQVLTAARTLTAKGVGAVMVTLGSKGTLLVTGEDVHKFPAYKVKAVDTTAAGDCFLAAFLSQFDGENYAEAIDFGARASAVAVTRCGAQSSIPTRAEIDAFHG